MSSATNLFRPAVLTLTVLLKSFLLETEQVYLMIKQNEEETVNYLKGGPGVLDLSRTPTQKLSHLFDELGLRCSKKNKIWVGFYLKVIPGLKD